MGECCDLQVELAASRLINSHYKSFQPPVEELNYSSLLACRTPRQVYSGSPLVCRTPGFIAAVHLHARHLNISQQSTGLQDTWLYSSRPLTCRTPGSIAAVHPAIRTPGSMAAAHWPAGHPVYYRSPVSPAGHQSLRQQPTGLLDTWVCSSSPLACWTPGYIVTALWPARHLVLHLQGVRTIGISAQTDQLYLFVKLEKYTNPKHLGGGG